VSLDENLPESSLCQTGCEFFRSINKMETVSQGQESNVVARSVARRMIERAQNLAEEEAHSSEEEIDEENKDVAFEEELLRAGDDPYDSDDPRSLGGEYYWNANEQQASLSRRARDNCRYGAFHIYRAASFFLLVFQYFFGLNKSRFQWAVDLVEKETLRRDMQILGRTATRDRNV